METMDPAMLSLHSTHSMCYMLVGYDAVHTTLHTVDV